MSNVWSELSAVDVSDHVEKKDGLTYLSWAWAWAEVKKRYPEATYAVLKNIDGMPYFQSDAGLMCFVSVSIDGLTHEMWLPVMNHGNKAMKMQPYSYQVFDKYKKVFIEKQVDAATMFDVNKTIMRCLVKCIAMFGLGHYIYAGEDLPQQPEVDEFADLKELMEDGNAFAFAFAVSGMNEDDQTRFFNSAEKGQKMKMKDQWRKLVAEGYAQADDLVDQIKEYCVSEDADSIRSEIEGVAKSALAYVGGKLNDIEKQFVRSALKNA